MIKGKYRSYLLALIEDMKESVTEFYQNVYLDTKTTCLAVGQPLADYSLDEDGLVVLENVNGEETPLCEQIINLSCLGTLTTSVLHVCPLVVGFKAGRLLPAKKQVLEFDEETSMKLLDINFSLLNKYVCKIQLPANCFDLRGISEEENVMKLSWLSKVDFTSFIVSDTDFGLLGIRGIEGRCIGSQFKVLDLSKIKNFDETLDAYFVDCDIESLIISNKTLLKAVSSLCEGCRIGELVIMDTEDIDKESVEYEMYCETMAKGDTFVFNGCTIDKISLVSNILLSHTFRTCTIDSLEISSLNSDGVILDESAVAYSNFKSIQRLNVGHLAAGAFMYCVINKGMNMQGGSLMCKPLALYVQATPYENSVTDAVSGFHECSGNYEVLDCTLDSINKSINMFEEGDSEDALYNTLYAMLYRGIPHYISLPKEFK